MTTEYSNSVTNNLMVYEYENTILQQICLLEQHMNVSRQHCTQGCWTHTLILVPHSIQPHTFVVREQDSDAHK